MSRYYISGRQIQLGKLIGSGGEGKVYLSAEAPSKAIKIYGDSGNSTRSEKIQKMVSLGLSKKTELISFPDEIVTSDSGKIIGFSMNFVRDHQPVHNLYGVKSRKHLFPDVDYRFLVRVATNIARAMAQVHASPCVIGDVNHSGVLISKNATVALIDADSFQLKEGGLTYPCVVGVPDFTPPELQGKSLRSVERTQIHDQFGLAVLIFQVLMMGRHPFFGKGRDLSLEECIAQNLFAYTKISSHGITPPPGVPTLDCFPEAISNAFEYSFASSGINGRTTANQWVSLLQEMENSLVKCSVNTKHYYVGQKNGCPWCKMENATGAILFNSGVSVLSSSFTIGDIEKVLSEILSFKIDDERLFPKLPDLLDPSATWLAKSAKTKRFVKKCISIFLWCVSLLSLLALFANQGIAMLICAGFFGWLAYQLGNNESKHWVTKYRDLENKWNESLISWREKVALGIFQTKYNLEKAIFELKELDKEKDYRLKKLKEGHRERQLQEFLDRHLIKNVKIKSISPSLVTSLASYGIESAADIDYNRIRNLPQFGDVRTGNLVAWRRGIEQSFQYNPSTQSRDISAQNQIANEFELKMRDKKNYIEQQKRIFDQARASISKISQFEDANLSEQHLVLEQLKVDLKFLKLPIPAPTPVAPIKKPLFAQRPQSYSGASVSQTSQSPSVTAPICPQCSSQMVRRSGRRGAFWGCSRYPRCKGTRNI
ncbi:topoisomerase DNA-binding C4 zinc finger domain-containing protein [Bdellovibrio sp. NC01]|uniref:topoisomerase DNA-binding C4 zinc finger domain-containing protein n=1 Tax=Bdellovibrio sp. NC01 TaxID=2220073 RepID=UPI00115BBBD2|nr:topoisomerase DNA-binding C4 zinc finger domain-containing protein [Bdellovibrio sp. NC01]QDK36415.1 hypothetical protein DOE51_01760 [Bdellovibrio sp. NC01]